MSQVRLFLLVVQIYVHLHMIKLISLYLHTNTYACMVPFLSFLRILYFPFEPLICLNMYTSSRHIHWHRRGCILVQGWDSDCR